MDRWERPKQYLKRRVAPAVPRGDETLPPWLGSKIEQVRSRKVVQSKSEDNKSEEEGNDDSRQNMMEEDPEDEDDHEAFNGEINKALEVGCLD